MFPSVSLGAKQYLLVWASGKDRVNSNSQLHTNFKIKSGGEAIVLTNPSNTKIDESSVIAISTDASYGRDPDGTGSWVIFNDPTPGESNTGNTASETEKIAINEIMSSNITSISDEDGAFEDWLEIYNHGSETINLQGFGLSDERDLPYKWVFPSITLEPNKYILVWASDKDRAAAGSELHTNFKISANGETLFLTNKSGNLVSGSPSVSLTDDVSYGRKPNGTGSWLYFETPTPGTSNTGNGSTTTLEPPIFSHDSGLYSDTFSLSLSTVSQGAEIIYTTDGSEPDINNLSGTSFKYKNDYPFEIGESFGEFLNETYTSKKYNSPISISDRSNDADKLTTKNTVQYDLFVPPVPVRKATIIKARTFLNGKGSKTTAKTFFVWNNGNIYNTPIISMQLNEESLFGYDNGIYTAGVDFDTWRTENPSGPQAIRPDINNYGRRGRDWEQPVNVEVFDKNLKSVSNINAGIRIHGNTSRQYVIKALRLYARSEYDEKNEFEFNLFNQKIPNSPLPYNNKFKRLLLRGNGSGGYIANDVIFSRLMQPFYEGVTRIETALHFFNGEYWGLTALRDRFDEDHFANNFGLDADNVVIADCNGSTCIFESEDTADKVSYRAMRDFIRNEDLSVEANYTHVENLLSIDSFINNLAFEIISEGDSYEIKYWRAKTKVNDGFGDAKWRVTTQDFESVMGSGYNWLEIATADSNVPTRDFLNNLLENETFKVKFINRIADLLNSAFIKERFDAVVNLTFDEIDPLLDEDNNRAPKQRFYGVGEKDRLLNWVKERPTLLRGQMNDLFNIDKTIDLDLNVSNHNAGYITVNTIDIKPSTPGIKEKPYPWTGVYFDNIPITLEAKPRQGYTFSHWSGGASGSNSKITVQSSNNIQIQAHFTPDENYSHLLYFWLLDDEIQNDSPLENLNSTYSRNDLTAKLIYSSALSGYPFDDNNSNWRKASLERINKPTAINYQNLANNNIDFAPQMMKGLQIKQPFKSGGSENNFQLEFSTIGYENIKVSLAIKSDGAANSLIAEYWNGSNWVTTNLSNNSQSINSEYQQKEFNFSNVSSADENDNFKVRFRFNGSNLTEDLGKKVIFNNISVSAKDKNVLSTEEYLKETQKISIYPNPTKDIIKIFSNASVEKVLVYNIFGKLVYQSTHKSNNQRVDMSRLSKGIYLVKVFSDGLSSTKKIVKE